MKLNLLKIVFGFLLSTLLSFPLFAQEVNSASEDTIENSSTQFIKGVDYSIVKPAQLEVNEQEQAKENRKTIEVYYWYGCKPCQQVEQALNEHFVENTEISMTRIPLVAHISWRPQAYLQPLMAQLQGKVDLPDIAELYNVCLSDCSVFRSYQSILDWLKQRNSLDELPFIEEPDIWAAEKNYQKMADSASISQVPTIIINKTYLTDANSAKSVERMIALIDYLLEKPLAEGAGKPLTP